MVNCITLPLQLLWSAEDLHLPYDAELAKVAGARGNLCIFVPCRSSADWLVPSATVISWYARCLGMQALQNRPHLGLLLLLLLAQAKVQRSAQVSQVLRGPIYILCGLSSRLC